MKKKLISFLKRHDAFERFCINLQIQKGLNFDDYFDGYSRTHDSFYSVTDYAFIWSNTLENTIFWSNIYKKWLMVYDKRTCELNKQIVVL